MENNSVLAELVSAKNSVKTFTVISVIIFITLLCKPVIIAINLPIYSEIMFVLAFVFGGMGVVLFGYLYFKYKSLPEGDEKCMDLWIRIGLMAIILIVMGIVCMYQCYEATSFMAKIH